MKKNKEQQDQERRQAEEERRTTGRVKHGKKGTGGIRKRAEYQEEEKER